MPVHQTNATGEGQSSPTNLQDEVKGGPLRMDAQVSTDGETNTTVRDELLKKLPPGQPVNPKVLLPLPNFMPVTHPVVFDCLDGSTIHS